MSFGASFWSNNNEKDVIDEGRCQPHSAVFSRHSGP